METDIKYRIDLYIETNKPDYTWRELATAVNDKFGTVYDGESLRDFWRNTHNGGRMTKKDGATASDKLEVKRNSFIKFLTSGKTEKEINERFGEYAEKLLKGKYDGLELYTQRNNYHEVVHILLPIRDKNVRLLPKEYKYHIGTFADGTEAPYLLVKIPDFKGKAIVAPMFDVHFGSHAHKYEKFLQYVRWVKETPNVYVILGGDIMENAIDDGRGMTYDQDHNPQSQLTILTEILSPIAHRILVSVPGNHEQRTEKKTGIDVAQVLAERLKVPYFPGPVFMSVTANTYQWTYYISHGYGNSQTKGGKANMAARPKGWTGLVHFFVSGHVHDCVVSSENILVEDRLNARLLEVKQWVVVAQSFLSWYKTYAYRAGYKPPASGGVSTELMDNGNYRAYLTD